MSRRGRWWKSPQAQLVAFDCSLPRRKLNIISLFISLNFPDSAAQNPFARISFRFSRALFFFFFARKHKFALSQLPSGHVLFSPVFFLFGVFPPYFSRVEQFDKLWTLVNFFPDPLPLPPNCFCKWDFVQFAVINCWWRWMCLHGWCGWEFARG